MLNLLLTPSNPTLRERFVQPRGKEWEDERSDWRVVEGTEKTGSVCLGTDEGLGGSRRVKVREHVGEGLGSSSL